MEKIKNNLSKVKNWLLKLAISLKYKVWNFFIRKQTAETSEKYFNSKNIILLIFSFIGIFVGVALFMPTKQELVYRETAKEPPKTDGSAT